MNILDKILAHKQKELQTNKELYPTKLLEQSVYFSSPTVSLKKYIRNPEKSGIIAEIKRQSPSKGPINPYISVEALSIGYMQAGASALSVLTDDHFFAGSNDDLRTARKFNFCPILRKDFTIDEYQIIEARSIGADAILLIARALEPAKLHSLAAFAKSLNLEVLLEVHTREELERAFCPDVDIVGVNNRNLDDFSVSIDHSLQLLEHLPASCAHISESGLRSPKTLLSLKQAGFHGFLIGEAFMKTSQPADTCARWTRELRELERKAQAAA